MELSGRSALLTGATGGLGRAIATALAGRGAKLILSGRKPEALEALAAELPGEGHRTVPADLAEPGAAERLAAEAGDVDVLVANAGLPGAGLLSDFAPAEVGRAVRVNLEAPMLLAQAFEPTMVERGSGHLVFIGSLQGKVASPRTSVYSATKFGLRGFAFALSMDLRPRGVGVSLVTPGFVREAGMFADSGERVPPGMGTVSPGRLGDAVLRAIEHDKLEVVVAQLPLRAMAQVGLISPGIADRAQRGSTGQRSAKAIADGHPADKR